MDQAGRIHGNTTTTTTITETHVQTNIRFDPTYVKTLPGALKLAAVVRIVIEFSEGVINNKKIRGLQKP